MRHKCKKSKIKQSKQTQVKMAELNKSASTEEFYIDLHGPSIKSNRLVIGHIQFIKMLFKSYLFSIFILIMYLYCIYTVFKGNYCIYCIYFFNFVKILILLYKLIYLYMYLFKLYLLMSYSSHIYIGNSYSQLTSILFGNKIYSLRACYIMLWPALTL